MWKNQRQTCFRVEFNDWNLPPVCRGAGRGVTILRSGAVQDLNGPTFQSLYVSERANPGCRTGLQIQPAVAEVWIYNPPCFHGERCSWRLWQ